MPFQAKMQLEKDEANEIAVLSAEYEFIQPTDSQNKPKGLPKANVLKVIIESSKDNRVIEWMVSPTMTKSVKITFYGDKGSVIRTIEMKDAYCLGFKEMFDHNDSQPFKAIIRLAALDENVKADGKNDTSPEVAVTKFVADTPEEEEVAPTTLAPQEEPEDVEEPEAETKPESASIQECTSEGHPIDVATGKMFINDTDVLLPGPIPFVWKCIWLSNSSYNGQMGNGWHNYYDLSLTVTKKQIIYRTDDGRDVFFPLIGAGERFFKRLGKMTLYYDGTKYTIYNHITRLQYSFHYNSHAQKYLLNGIYNSGGFSILFKYDNQAILSNITDSSGRSINVITNENHCITSLELLPENPAIGKPKILVGYEYDNNNCRIACFDPLGNSEHFTYNNSRQIIKHKVRSGINFYFEYDNFGIDSRCIHTWGDGNMLDYSFSYLPEANKTISENILGERIYYHVNGLVTKTIDPLGNITEKEYNEFNELVNDIDSLQNTTNYSYDNNGNLISINLPNGSSVLHQYNANNQLVVKIDADGEKWKWEYDELGNIIKSIDALGNITNYTFDNNGLLTGITDSQGNTSSLFYNHQGQLESLNAPNGQKTKWLYNNQGFCTNTFYSNGTEQRLFYDAAMRIIKTKEPDGNVRHIEYNAAGKPLLTYDDDQKTSFMYDGIGNLISQTQANFTIQFTYDSELNLTSVINENGEKYLLELDENGRIKTEIGFDGVKKIYQRNAIGQITKILRPDNRSTEYSYNKAGLITAVKYHDETTEQYTYSHGGKMLSASNENSEVVFTYNALGKVLTESAAAGTVQSIYENASGLRSNLNSTLGANIRMTRNFMGDVLSVEANGWLANIGRTVEGWEINRSLPGNVENRWKLNNVGQPLVHQVYNANAKQSNSLDKHYTWGTNNLLLQLTNRVNHNKTTFQYDDRLYLTNARHTNGTQPEMRVPDNVGNLFNSLNKNERSYGVGGRLLETYDGTKFTYDAEGNLICKKDKKGNGLELFWNAAGKLERVVKSDGGTITFGYDVFGRRIWKKYKATTTKWLWDGNKPLHEWKEFDSKESTIDEIITWVFEENSFAPSAKLKGNKKYSIINDHLGTPIQGYDFEGTLIWERELDIYGKPNIHKGNEGFCNYLYQGQIFDIETGLTYNRFRYYSPDEGLYISQDPISLQAGKLNLYSYVDDPNSFTDPFGLVGGCKTPAVLPDDAAVVRGGTNLAAQFTNGSGVTTDNNGKLNGVSVNSVAGMSVADLSQGIPNGKIGVTTVGAIRALGGDVVSSPTRNNPNHATLSGITAAQASTLFNPIIPNPSKNP